MSKFAKPGQIFTYLVIAGLIFPNIAGSWRILPNRGKYWEILQILVGPCLIFLNIDKPVKYRQNEPRRAKSFLISPHPAVRRQILRILVESRQISPRQAESCQI